MSMRLPTAVALVSLAAVALFREQRVEIIAGPDDSRPTRMAAPSVPVSTPDAIVIGAVKTEGYAVKQYDGHNWVVIGCVENGAWTPAALPRCGDILHNQQPCQRRSIR